MASKDWEQLRNDLGDALTDSLKGLVMDAANDLAGPVRDAANRLAIAVRRNDPELVAEIKDQLLLLAEEQKIRLNAKGELLFDTVVTSGLDLLFRGANAGINAVKTN